MPDHTSGAIIHSQRDIVRLKQRDRMRQMASAGFSKTQTAIALGVSRASVHRFARTSDVVFRHGRAQISSTQETRPIGLEDETRVHDRDDYREAIQDMKPIAAVDHLLGLLDGLTHTVPEMGLTPLPGLTLTRLESRLLYQLDRCRGRPVAKETLMFAMYQLRPYDDWPDTGIVGVRICALRRKLRQAGISDIRIETRCGEGFCLRASDGRRLDWGKSPVEGEST